MGSPYSIQLLAHGGCTPYKFRNSMGALPPGISLTSSGLVSGTPTASGSWRFWLQLISACPGDPTADREFSISVQPGLRILTNELPQGATVGAPYSVTLQTMLVTSLSPLTGSQPGSLTWSVLPGGALPPGLTLGDGVISGTPTTEGAYQFRVQAELDATRKHFQTYSMAVRQPLSIKAATPLGPTSATVVWEVGVPFAAKMFPSGGTGTYTWVVAEGALPVGLGLTADGVLVGKPREAGPAKAVIRLGDTEGRTLDYPVTFGVAERLAISTARLAPGEVGKRYRAKLATTGGLPPRTWRVAGGRLPRGVKLIRRLGVLAGVPRKPGSYRVRLEVRDGLKVSVRKTLRMFVAG